MNGVSLRNQNHRNEDQGPIPVPSNLEEDTEIPTADEQQSTCRKISRFRFILPQVIATTAKSLILMGLSMLLGFATVLIPVLTNSKDNDPLHLSLEQASWYGSLTYLLQPLGSLTSGSLLQSFGCKKIMIFINIPKFLCWLLVYYASSSFALFAVSILIGLVIGALEAPIIRYIGEISHPSLRGILTIYSSLFFSVGLVAVNFLGSLTDWRHVAIISSLVPILSMIAVMQVPETPMWLISKGRREEALKSLQWLRGWTEEEDVKEEFEKLEIYEKKKVTVVKRIVHSYGQDVDTKNEEPTPKANGGVDGTGARDIESNGKDVIGGPIEMPSASFEMEEEVAYYESEKRTFADKWRDLTRREMLLPLGKCILFFSLSVSGGLPPIRPYAVRIFMRLNLPIQANWTSVWCTLLGVFGNVACMLLMNRVGKKWLFIFSGIASAVCCALMSIIIMTLNIDLENASAPSYANWSLLAFFLLYFFVYCVGLQPLPWVYVSELIPYRGRGIGTGVVASWYYLSMFVAVKLYPSMEGGIGLQGVFLLFTFTCTVACFFGYFYLPVTEGKFLADIESKAHKSRKTENETT